MFMSLKSGEKSCDLCERTKCAFVWKSVTTRWCVLCFYADRAVRRDLVKKMKDVKNVKPPLGYGLFYGDYIADKARAKTFADSLFELPWGAEH